jgi:hypothetical protein
MAASPRPYRGPGNGIQLRNGRIVIACDHVRRDNKERHSHVIYSDDGGGSSTSATLGAAWSRSSK